MSRRNARKNTFYLLFSLDFAEAYEKDEIIRIFFEENPQRINKIKDLTEETGEYDFSTDAGQGLTERDKEFILSEISGVMERLSEIDELINEASVGWPVLRMSKVDLAILRLAVFEIKFSKETPVSVSINEAVELAKKFSSDEAPAFINGILGKIAG